MTSLVPQPDCRLLKTVFIAQRAQARRTQHERPGVECVDPNPARGQHAEEMPAGKKENVSWQPSQAIHDAIGARGDLLRRFAPRTAIAEEFPIWTLRADLDRPATFILTVVPLDEIAIDFRNRSEAGQFTGL